MFYCPIYMYIVYIILIKLYHRGNYETLALELTRTDWSSLKDNNVDVYAQNVTDRMFIL